MKVMVKVVMEKKDSDGYEMMNGLEKVMDRVFDVYDRYEFVGIYDYDKYEEDLDENNNIG